MWLGHRLLHIFWCVIGFQPRYLQYIEKHHYHQYLTDHFSPVVGHWPISLYLVTSFPSLSHLIKWFPVPYFIYLLSLVLTLLLLCISGHGYSLAMLPTLNPFFVSQSLSFFLMPSWSITSEPFLSLVARCMLRDHSRRSSRSRGSPWGSPWARGRTRTRTRTRTDRKSVV